ncbi:DUF1349 domain-containing protein [Frigoriglobus tundricola]|uniref:Beta-xylosidase C-terminal Concanavalin A-like domain-containing protein n=1 Tax=Frigoriglobus tundricola TaxID=2774151 RepID=A0A6M5YW21_9BACT|nr:hypothetical protein [Frigoriglobus tundricola]QJW97511.1 hypothetical protein FTUN_5085 [Frigoriglobus tundricola]
MIRLAPLLVLVVAATTAAAPVPPPTEKERLAKHWGTFEGQGEYELTGNRLTLRTAGQPTFGLYLDSECLPIPRVTRTVRGDFEATVTVLYATPPHKGARHDLQRLETQAGLFVGGGGSSVEFGLMQLHSKFNGIVADYLQRCVWVRTRSDKASGGSMLKLAPVGTSTHLRVVRKDKQVTVSYSFDGKTWSEPQEPGHDPELPDEVAVGVSFSQSTYQTLSADFHAFTLEKPKAAKKE